MQVDAPVLPIAEHAQIVVVASTVREMAVLVACVAVEMNHHLLIHPEAVDPKIKAGQCGSGRFAEE